MYRLLIVLVSVFLVGCSKDLYVMDSHDDIDVSGLVLEDCYRIEFFMDDVFSLNRYPHDYGIFELDLIDSVDFSIDKGYQLQMSSLYELAFNYELCNAVEVPDVNFEMGDSSISLRNNEFYIRGNLVDHYLNGNSFYFSFCIRDNIVK